MAAIPKNVLLCVVFLHNTCNFEHNQAQHQTFMITTLDCSFQEILSTKSLDHFSAFYWQPGIKKFDKPI